MKRIGQVIKVKPEYLEKYKTLHANPWPEVNEMIKKCNISNYSIYYRNGYLFSCFEYTGDDYEADMKKMADDPHDAEMVEGDRSLPGAGGGRQARRMVGGSGGSVSSGLKQRSGLSEKAEVDGQEGCRGGDSADPVCQRLRVESAGG